MPRLGLLREHRVSVSASLGASSTKLPAAHNGSAAWPDSSPCWPGCQGLRGARLALDLCRGTDVPSIPAPEMELLGSGSSNFRRAGRAIRLLAWRSPTTAFVGSAPLPQIQEPASGSPGRPTGPQLSDPVARLPGLEVRVGRDRWAAALQQSRQALDCPPATVERAAADGASRRRSTGGELAWVGLGGLCGQALGRQSAVCNARAVSRHALAG